MNGKADEVMHIDLVLLRFGKALAGHEKFRAPQRFRRVAVRHTLEGGDEAVLLGADAAISILAPFAVSSGE
jgi:hypothetical protein